MSPRVACPSATADGGSLQTVTIPTPTAGAGEVLIRVIAASLNHRDVFQRRGLYPGTAPSIPLLADGYGVVLTPSSKLHRKAVILNPLRGWIGDPRGPEADGGAFAILGGTTRYRNGTLQEFLVMAEEDLVEAPAHLSPEEAAALPLCGLTAWRAVVTKGQVARGDNVLIPGIGGGVALMALLFAVRRGAKVWVTSSSEQKIGRAVALGAEGGVLYTSDTWEKELAALLPKDRPWVDTVVDGAGGNVVEKVTRVMRTGGRVVSYGMTLGPKLPFPMGAVLKNIDLLGSTMGSRREFLEMVAFVSETELRPVVSRVVRGLDEQQLEGLWEDMEKGRQFGKLVVRIAEDAGAEEKGRL
jgi:NADPH:quinone reductase-like Zn-dependent oxidoreductase